MHGLINRSIQAFVCQNYGEDAWKDILRKADIPGPGFEPMLIYEDRLTDDVLDAAAIRLRRPRDVILEDIGAFLVSHPSMSSVRRLLRFGGDTFMEFLDSLDDLPDRARLAVPDLDLPTLELVELVRGKYEIFCHAHWSGYGFLCSGVLRAMADDYGALVFLEHLRRVKGAGHALGLTIFDCGFSKGREFALAVPLA